jgi:hypothetical protein
MHQTASVPTLLPHPSSRWRGPLPSLSDETWAWWSSLLRRFGGEERSRPRQAATAAAAASPQPVRLTLLEPDDPLHARALPEPLLLGRLVGEGSSHEAYRLESHHPAGGELPWVAIVSLRDLVSAARHPPAIIHAMKLQRDHLRRIARCAPDLLPGYGGIALAGLPGGDQRFASIWQAKDATLGDLVDRGGLIGRALLDSHPLAAADIAAVMMRLGELYQHLHRLGMAYTDPKPHNLAFDYHRKDGQQPPAEAGSSWRLPARAAYASCPAGARQGERMHDLVFIDAQSLHEPGYRCDAAAEADGFLTPMWASAGVLSALQLKGRVLKQAQTDPTNDVFHMAAISYGLLAGTAPQRVLYDRRYREVSAALRSATLTSTVWLPVQVLLQLRLSRDFAVEERLLGTLADQGLFPLPLAEVILDALHGRIATLAAWGARTAAALGEAGLRLPD